MIRASAAAPRAVAAPTPRRLSSQAAPGAPVNTVGAIAANCGYSFGVSATEPRIRSGCAAVTALRSGALRVPTPGRPEGAPQKEG